MACTRPAATAAVVISNRDLATRLATALLSQLASFEFSSMSWRSSARPASSARRAANRLLSPTALERRPWIAGSKIAESSESSPDTRASIRLIRMATRASRAVTSLASEALALRTISSNTSALARWISVSGWKADIAPSSLLTAASRCSAGTVAEVMDRGSSTSWP
jgi:hypothetical protein